MKKATIARFVMGMAAIFAAGCSAETGAPEAEGVGQTEQAIGIASQTASNYAAQFAAVAVVGNKMYQAGGFDVSGNAVSNVAVFDYTSGSPGTATALTSLPTIGGVSQARGQAQLIPIPGTSNGKLLLVGGTTVFDGGTPFNNALIYDVAGNTWTAVTDTMSAARFAFTLDPCGTSKLLAVGGETGGGATNTMDVFTYVSTNSGADSTFDPLKNGATTVNLANPRAYHASVPISTTKIIAGGGEDSGTIRQDIEIISVDSNCATATKASSNFPDVTANHPDKRSKLAAIKINGSDGTHTFDALFAGGTTDGVNGSTTAYRFSSASTVWSTAGTISAARVFPQLSKTSTSGQDLLIGGASVNLANSSAVVDSYSESGNTWTTSGITQLTTKRYGFALGLLNSTVLATQGLNVTSGTPALLSATE